MGFRFIWLPSDKLSDANAADDLPMPPDSSYALFLQARKDLAGYAQNDDGSGAPADSSPAGYWASQVGGYIGTQGTSSAKPTLITNALNGYPVLRFDGGDVLTLGDVLDMGTSHLTMCVVGKKTSGNGTYVGKNKATTTAGRYSILYSGGGIIGTYTNAAGDQLASTGRAGGSYEYLTQVIDRSGSNTLYANGSQLGQKTFTDDSAENHNVGFPFLLGAITDAAETGYTIYLTGDIAEVILYQGLPDLTALHNYVSSKFGL